MWKPKVVKMSNMKCPFCNKPLQPTLRLSDEYWCENYDCPRTNIKWTGSQKLWQELIRTRKALDVAKDKLDTVRQYHRGTAVIRPDDIAAYCDRAIDQITTLEQKDVE